MIGNLYDINSHIKHKMTVRVSALVLMFGIGFGGFSLFKPGIDLPWQPFSESAVDESLAKRKTILIDFTADW